jgi:outer membrane protein assembly factor BamB
MNAADIAPPFRLRWQAELEGETWSTPAVVDDGQRSVVLVCDRSGSIGALDGASGTRIWQSRLGDVVTSSPLATEGIAIWSGHDGSLLATDAFTGAVLWSASRPAVVRATPAAADVDGDGASEVVVADYADRVVCLALLTGEPRWEVKLPRLRVAEMATRGIVASPAIADVDADGHAEVIVGTRAKRLYCLDAATGRLKWLRRFGYCIDLTATPAVLHGVPLLFVGTGESLSGLGDSSVYALEGSNGRTRWRTKLRGGVDSSPLLVADGAHVEPRLFVSTLADASCYAIDAMSGRIEWRHRFGPTDLCVHDQENVCHPAGRRYVTDDAVCRSYATPVGGDLDGDGELEIVFGSNNGTVVCLRAATGEFVWHEETGGAVRGSPLLADVDRDGRDELLVPSGDRLFAFSTQSVGAGWTMFKGGPRHEGRIGRWSESADPGSVRRVCEPWARFAALGWDAGRYGAYLLDRRILAPFGLDRSSSIY